MVHLPSKHSWGWLIQLLLAYPAQGNLSIFQDVAEDPKFVVNFTDFFIGETSLSFYMDPSKALPGIDPEAINGTSCRRIILRGEEGSKFLCNVVSPKARQRLHKIIA
ncbi:hypothetical protein DSO57_1006535 [Entomophthora muscae]|uniref:Uncharacterized protein n=1 Tax=Entomophthora muscae TaxID=34485 RepID=A0ACC2S9J6_9FUNG|nr:hypothetical protein DSO57_1006535 [Entomophthora muscae]